MTTLSVLVKLKVAPDTVLLRSHIADMVQGIVLDWMHENTYDTIESTDDPVDIIDIVIAR
jgi:hypothetical protein